MSSGRRMPRRLSKQFSRGDRARGTVTDKHIHQPVSNGGLSLDWPNYH
jgi:hypothetical protein